MKIKYIDGCVYYYRREKEWIKQFCPYKDIGCGEWCPMHWIYTDNDGCLELRLCHSSLPIGNIEV